MTTGPVIWSMRASKKLQKHYENQLRSTFFLLLIYFSSEFVSLATDGLSDGHFSGVQKPSYSYSNNILIKNNDSDVLRTIIANSL